MFTCSVLPKRASGTSRMRVAMVMLALALVPFFGAASAAGQATRMYVYAVAVQDDGRIVAAGFRDVGAGNLAFALARYTEGGTRDTDFGVGGIATTDFGPGNDTIEGLVVQSDGKIVVAGHSSGGDGWASNFGLARYNVDGSPDQGFGSSGKVETNFGGDGGFDDRAYDVAIQDDGKIVAAGMHDTVDFESARSDFDFALARYNADGRLDQSFGSGGLVTAAIGYSVATSLAIQRDGRIVAAGVAGWLYEGRFTLVRFLKEGSLDTSFGSGGVVTTLFDPNDYQAASDVAIQSNGRIVAAGLREPAVDASPNTDLALAGYTKAGRLDPQFGEAGKVTTDFGGREGIEAIALERNGGMITAGTYVVRYDKKGKLDTRFGGDGRIERSAGSLAIQHNGKIVAGGGTELARYNRDGSLDTSFGNGGIVSTG